MLRIISKMMSQLKRISKFMLHRRSNMMQEPISMPITITTPKAQ